MTCKIKCDCCEREFECVNWDIPEKWTSSSVVVEEHSDTGKLEQRSCELHACADCSSYMSLDEMCEAAVEILKKNMHQAQRPTITDAASLMDLQDFEPGEIVKPSKIGLTLNELVVVVTGELEQAVRLMHQTTGAAHVHITRDISSHKGAGIVECKPTGVVTLTVRPD